jgi:aminocarboxymuconate-semialdehyde decarboxylase
MKGLRPGTQGSAIGRREFVKLGATAGAMMTLNVGESLAKPTTGQRTSIDVHTHWAPEAYSKALEEVRPPTGESPNPLDFDLDRRRKWMDQHGVQMHTLTLSGAMPWQWVPPDVGAHLAQIINDAAIEAHTAFPDRFVAGIEMSIRDPELALKELNRMADKPGMRAVHLPNSFEGNDYLLESAYAPLLARCETLGYPLLLHPLDGEINYYGGKGTRLGGKWQQSANLSNTLGFPFETATTAAKLIISGTLDKFPGLEILLPHAGGSFPYIAGRVEHGLERRKFKLQHPFKEYVRRFHYDTLTYDAEALRFLISLVGSDRVVIGTDNFAGMDVEQPNELIEQLKMPAENRDRIFRGNAIKLLHL